MEQREQWIEITPTGTVTYDMPKEVADYLRIIAEKWPPSGGRAYNRFTIERAMQQLMLIAIDHIKAGNLRTAYALSLVKVTKS